MSELVWEREERQMALAYQSAAEKYANNSNGVLGVVPYDVFSTYEPQRLDVHRIDGSPVLPEALAAISTNVYPAFPHLTLQLAEQEAATGVLSRAADALGRGKNVVVPVNHGTLLDPGVTLAALSNSLRLIGAQFRCGIIVGKMLPFQSLYGIPVPDMLKLLCDDIYFTMPNTPSREELNIDPRVAKAYNLATLQILDSNLDLGSNVLLYVPDGTTQKAQVDDPNKVVVGVAKSTLTRYFIRPDTLMLPAAAALENQTAPLLSLGNLAPLRSIAEMQTITEWTIDALNAAAPEKEFTLPPELSSQLGAQALHQDEKREHH